MTDVSLEEIVLFNERIINITKSMGDIMVFYPMIPKEDVWGRFKGFPHAITNSTIHFKQFQHYLVEKNGKKSVWGYP